MRPITTGTPVRADQRSAACSWPAWRGRTGRSDEARQLVERWVGGAGVDAAGGRQNRAPSDASRPSAIRPARWARKRSNRASSSTSATRRSRRQRPGAHRSPWSAGGSPCQLVAGSPQLVVGAGTVPIDRRGGPVRPAESGGRGSTCCPAAAAPDVHVVVVILGIGQSSPERGSAGSRHQVQRSAHRHLHGDADVLGDHPQRERGSPRAHRTATITDVQPSTVMSSSRATTRSTTASTKPTAAISEPRSWRRRSGRVPDVSTSRQKCDIRRAVRVARTAGRPRRAADRAGRDAGRPPRSGRRRGRRLARSRRRRCGRPRRGSGGSC